MAGSSQEKEREESRMMTMMSVLQDLAYILLVCKIMISVFSLSMKFQFNPSVLFVFVEREVDWVQCDGGCELWFHLFCVGLDKRDVKEDEDFICRVCQGRGSS